MSLDCWVSVCVCAHDLTILYDAVIWLRAYLHCIRVLSTSNFICSTIFYKLKDSFLSLLFWIVFFFISTTHDDVYSIRFASSWFIHFRQYKMDFDCVVALSWQCFPNVGFHAKTILSIEFIYRAVMTWIWERVHQKWINVNMKCFFFKKGY